MNKEHKRPNRSLLEVKNLKTYFPVREGFLKNSKDYVRAVDDVSFSVYPQETLAIVGESGCGKTTLIQTIMCLIDSTSGTINFQGRNLTHLSSKDLRVIRKDLQIVFQDPYASLNPRMIIGKIIGEPLEIHAKLKKGEIKNRVYEMLELVGLEKAYYNRHPHEFSGGQRQRISIARALILKPKLILCDEPVSALDVSIQSQILNLLIRLQKELNLTYIFISHALNVVRHISNNVAVMYLGKIVEMAPVEEIFNNPLHPYTKALLSAIPIPDPSVKRKRIKLEGDIASPKSPPQGCRFVTRCPYSWEKCINEEPRLKEVSANRFVACFLNWK